MTTLKNVQTSTAKDFINANRCDTVKLFVKSSFNPKQLRNVARKMGIAVSVKNDLHSNYLLVTIA